MDGDKNCYYMYDVVAIVFQLLAATPLAYRGRDGLEKLLKTITKPDVKIAQKNVPNRLSSF